MAAKNGKHDTSNSSSSKHQSLTYEAVFVAPPTSARRPCGCPAVQCQQGCAGSRPDRRALAQCCTRRRLHVAADRVRMGQRSSSSCRIKASVSQERTWKISDSSIEYSICAPVVTQNDSTVESLVSSNQYAVATFKTVPPAMPLHIWKLFLCEQNREDISLSQIELPSINSSMSM